MFLIYFFTIRHTSIFIVKSFMENGKNIYKILED